MMKYIGITIGPIHESLQDASTPAALWFASSIFSDITCRICMELHNGNIFSEVDIYTPFYDPSITMEDGVGKFHDRIIFSTTDYDDTKMKEFVNRIKRETGKNFSANINNTEIETFLVEYLQIHYIVMSPKELNCCDTESRNCILAMSPYLDALECMQTLPSNNEYNVFRKMLLGDRGDANKRIKESLLFRGIDQAQNQIARAGQAIWSIEELAEGKNITCVEQKDTKSLKYFAVVQADGDKMGTFLGTLKNEEVSKFSKICLDYTRKASNMVKEFGGMTIYAGGDDLLFLAPVVNVHGDTVFSLCGNINEKFCELMRNSEIMKDSSMIPTISSGISIQYVKSPLYEALNTARSLLFETAKQGTKNQMALKVQKHSGQTLDLLVSNYSYKKFEKLLAFGNDIKSHNEMVHSVIYTLEIFEKLVNILIHEVVQTGMCEEAFLVRWKNLFDNARQQVSMSYLEGLASIFYHDYLLSASEKNEANVKDNVLKDFLYALRLKKFLIEKGTEA